MTPAVSWIITVKNGMPFLPETMASIAAQTFADFEVVVWLVESTDSSEEELARWIPGRFRGEVIKSGPIGLGAARAELVKRARGEFCACIDADDLNEPERLAKQMDFMRRNPQVALVGSRLRVIDEGGRLLEQKYDTPLEHEDIEHAFLVGNCIGHSSVLLRRAAILEIGNYDDSAPIEDFDLWLRLAQRFRFGTLPDYLVRYRVHPLNHTGRVGHSLVESRANETFSLHARALYGLDAAEARRLRERNLPCTLPAAIRIVSQLARRRGGGFLRILRSHTLLDSLWTVTGVNDHWARLVLGLADSRPRRFGHAWHNARNALFASLPFGSQLLASVRARRMAKRMPAKP